jgi:hypothetical protein
MVISIGRDLAYTPDVDRTFNFAEEFVRKLQSGTFDGRVTEEVARLSREQLEQIVQLLAESEWSRRETSSPIA